MPVYLTPGVYIEEIERGPRPIEGVPTSIAAFIGETERGPDMPHLVTSYREYTRLFGSAIQSGQYMPFAVNGFFENGGQDLYIARMVGRGAVASTFDFGSVAVSSLGQGSYGNNIWVNVKESSTKAPDPKQPNKSVPVGFRLVAAYWPNRASSFKGFDPTVAAITSGSGASPTGGAGKQTEDRTPPEFFEVFDDLSLDPASPDYFEKRINDSSALITIAAVRKQAQAGAGAGPAPVTALPMPSTKEGFMSGGKDDPTPVKVIDFIGDWGDGKQPTGLLALELDPFRDVSLVYAPYPRNEAQMIAQAVIDHCERIKFRFAVVDCSNNQSDLNGLLPRDNLRDSAYGAFYYPWLWVANPQSGVRTLVPPGGHALGVYARVDSARGVYKAPANEVPRGATKLEFDINDSKQALLNPRGVNVIRSFPGRGILIWGARTMSSKTLWKQVSVRRLFIFLERSIYEGTQWVVFEPNDQRLWARVKDSIRLFLRTQWHEGALFGASEDEAFFITCDRSTMTQDDILNGRLICEIGIAPVRPAEFVVFRIFQNTADPQH
jgi:uncharacterized protein